MNEPKVKYKFDKLAAELRKFTAPGSERGKDGKYVDVDKTPTLFKDTDTGVLILSAEDGGYFADYYGEFRGGYPWIDPRLIEWAEKKGLMWEWRDPGSVGLWE